MPWLTVLGVPALAYVTSIVALMFGMSGSKQSPSLLIGSALITSSIYIFHRSDACENQHMQKRHELASAHRRLLLLLSILLFISSLVPFAMHNPLVALISFCSFAGIIAYGRGVMMKPLRSIPFIKPCMVGFSIALFGWVLNSFDNSYAVLFAFMLLCTADALVCDLIDISYDRATGCSTLACSLGGKGVWLCSLFAYICAGLFLQSITGWLFVALFVLPFLNRDLTRFFVDLRPTLVLLIVCLL